MPDICCVPFCRTGYRPTKEFPEKITLPLFKFPNDAELKKKWIKAIPRANFSPTTGSRVCSAHFHPECIKTADTFVVDSQTTSLKLEKTRLLHDAIPTIFPGNIIEHFDHSQLSYSLIYRMPFISVKETCT